MSAIKTDVRAFLDENFIMPVGAVLSDADSFLEGQLLDSTGFLELIGFLEERFAIKVGDHEMLPENLDSLNAIETYLARKRADAAIKP